MRSSAVLPPVIISSLECRVGVNTVGGCCDPPKSGSTPMGMSVALCPLTGQKAGGGGVVRTLKDDFCAEIAENHRIPYRKQNALSQVDDRHWAPWETLGHKGQGGTGALPFRMKQTEIENQPPLAPSGLKTQLPTGANNNHFSVFPFHWRLKVFNEDFGLNATLPGLWISKFI